MTRLFAALLLAASPALAQTIVPEIPFEGNINPLILPTGFNWGEVAGVAVNAQAHVFVFTRTGERAPCTAHRRRSFSSSAPTDECCARSARTSMDLPSRTPS